MWLIKSLITKPCDELIKGFVDGSLLAYYLQDKDPAIEKNLKSRMRELMHAKFGRERLEIPIAGYSYRVKKMSEAAQNFLVL